MHVCVYIYIYIYTYTYLSFSDGCPLLIFARFRASDGEVGFRCCDLYIVLSFREEQWETCRGGQTTRKVNIYLGDFWTSQPEQVLTLFPCEQYLGSEIQTQISLRTSRYSSPHPAAANSCISSITSLAVWAPGSLARYPATAGGTSRIPFGDHPLNSERYR